MKTTLKTRAWDWLVRNEAFLTGMAIVLLALAVVGSVEMVRP